MRGAGARCRAGSRCAWTAAGIPSVVATGLHAASLAILPASLLLRPHAPPPGTPAAWDRTGAVRLCAARQRPPQTPSDRAPPPGVSGPAHVDRSRSSAPDGSVAASVARRRPGLVAARVSGAGVRGGRRLMAVRAAGARSRVSPTRSGCPRPNAARGARATKSQRGCERPRDAEASRGPSEHQRTRYSINNPSATSPTICRLFADTLSIVSCIVW